MIPMKLFDMLAPTRSLVRELCWCSNKQGCGVKYILPAEYSYMFNNVLRTSTYMYGVCMYIHNMHGAIFFCCVHGRNAIYLQSNIMKVTIYGYMSKGAMKEEFSVVRGTYLVGL